MKCPQCGSEEVEQTLIWVISGPDPNTAKCSGCGLAGKVATWKAINAFLDELSAQAEELGGQVNRHHVDPDRLWFWMEMNEGQTTTRAMMMFNYLENVALAEGGIRGLAQDHVKHLSEEEL